MKTIGILALVVLGPLVLAGSAVTQEKTGGGTEMWEIATGPEGIPVPELVGIVEKTTGATIQFDAAAPQNQAKRVRLPNRVEMKLDGVLDWLRGVLLHHKLVLVPVGSPQENRWAMLNTSDPSIASHPIHVYEEDLDAWKHRDGAYVVTVLKAKHIADTTRARNSLANLVTRPVGRVQDVPGARAFVVGDYAPVVWALAQMVRTMDAAAKAEVEARPRQTTAERDTTVDRYEHMLMNARTETAAKYFQRRIDEVRRTGR